MAKNPKVVVSLDADTKNFTVQMQKAENTATKFQKNIKKVNGDVTSMGGAFRNAANSTSILLGPLNGVSGRLSSLASAFSTLNPAVVAGGLAFSGLSAFLAASVSQASLYEQQMMRVEGVLKATGYAAGLSGDDIDEFSKKLGRDTLASAEGVREAAAALATFRNISGQNFTKTISLAQDMSAALGQNLRSSVLQLGKALEEPITGITSLRKAGISFTDAEKKMITANVEAGRSLEAQGLILDKVTDQVGGAGAAEGAGLAGAVDLLGENFTEFMITLAETTRLKDATTAFFNAAASGVNSLNDAIRPQTSKELEKLLELELDRSGAKNADRALGEQDPLDVGPHGESPQAEAIRAQLRRARDREFIEAEDHAANMLTGIRTRRQIEEDEEAARLGKTREQSEEFLRVMRDRRKAAEAIALGISGNSPRASEDARHGRATEKLDAEIQRIIDKNALTEEIEVEAGQRREALELEHRARLREIDINEQAERVSRAKEAAEAEAEAMKTSAEEQQKTQKAKAKVTDAYLSLTGESFGVLAASMREGTAEQRTLFAAEKSIGLARSMLALQVAIAKANEFGITPIDKAMYIAEAASIGLGAISTIQSISAAHGGLTRVPKEQTYLLDRGERVLSPNQNKDFTDFISGGGAGGNLTVNIVEDAGRAGQVQRNDNDLTVFVAAALNEVNRQIGSGRGVASTIERRYNLTRRAS